MVSRERAQLILVGSIAIAVVLIGLTIVLNSAVFTENVAGGSSVGATGDVAEFDREAIRNVRSLVVRINHESVYSGTGGGETTLKGDVRQNVSAYSDVLAESYADSGSVYVNVTYEETGAIGNRIVQDDDANFSDNPGSDTWTLVDEPFVLGWYVVNVDVQNVSQTDPFYLELTDASGTELNVSMQQTSDGELDVNASIAGGNVSDVTCTPKNGRVLLDVLDGTSYTGDCSFNSTGYLQRPYAELRVVDGENGRGKYDVVMNRTDTASLNGVPNCASVNEPCRSIAAWSVNVTTVYETGSLSHERNREVTVYDP